MVSKNNILQIFGILLCLILVSEIACAQTYYFTDEYFKETFGPSKAYKTQKVVARVGNVETLAPDPGMYLFFDTDAFHRQFGEPGMPTPQPEPVEAEPAIVEEPEPDEVEIEIIPVEEPVEEPEEPEIEIVPVEEPVEEVEPETAPEEEGEEELEIDLVTDDETPTGDVIAEGNETDTPAPKKRDSTQLALIGLLIIIVIVMLIVLLTRESDEDEDNGDDDWKEGEFFKEVKDKKDSKKKEPAKKKEEPAKEEKPAKKEEAKKEEPAKEEKEEVKEEPKEEPKKEEAKGEKDTSKPFLLKIKEGED